MVVREARAGVVRYPVMALAVSAMTSAGGLVAHDDDCAERRFVDLDAAGVMVLMARSGGSGRE